MSHTRLRRLVGMALVDEEFCDGLMNGGRSALLSEFDLTGEEREIVASFETESVRDLVSVVHGWLKEQGSAAPSHMDCNAAQVL